MILLVESTLLPIEHVIKPRDEVLGPQGTSHYDRMRVGTRTIHCYGEKRIIQEEISERDRCSYENKG